MMTEERLFKNWMANGFEALIRMDWQKLFPNNLYWHQRDVSAKEQRSVEFVDALLSMQQASRVIDGIYMRMHPQRGDINAKSRDRAEYIARILDTLFVPMASVVDIPIQRRATADELPTKADDKDSPLRMSGRGVIKLLARMQAPAEQISKERVKDRKLHEFVQELAGDSSARVWVPSIQDRIHCELHGQEPLRLEQLGSGIEQVVLHAIVCTAFEKRVITFEEPELHLHPTLQRKLLRHLSEKTDNQYFISTHSAHVIDTPGANVFHVTMQERESRVTFVDTHDDKWEVCRALGYRASDLVQTNCVIWVEGPSDRIYLRHWLAAADADLKEHVHYSIMFYGGRLLSHLTAEESDECLEELISLRLINRNVCVIADSDRREAGSKVSKTKTRLVEELNSQKGVAWITAGREIENYVSANVMTEAVDAIKSGSGSEVKTGQYDQVLPGSGKKKTVDKVKTALEVAKRPADLKVLDLRKRIDELVKFIRASNGL